VATDATYPARVIEGWRVRWLDLRQRRTQRRLGRAYDRVCFPPPPDAFASYGERTHIAQPARVELPGRIHLGSDTVILEHVWLSLVASFPDRPPTLRVGDRVWIGRACEIACVGEIVIEDDVKISDGVHIGDTYHRYDVPGLPARKQPMAAPRAVRICRGAFINFGAIIHNGVTVGANAYVHAGAVVSRDVPPGAVVLGLPARIVDRSQPWA
jgi:carbonic anhydrase/acetyltransferase-like protein (isoleucine patch superfamily)